MKKLFIVPAVIAAALTFASPAHADEDAFITDLANNNFTGPTDAALTLGYQICTDIAHDVPAETTVEAVYQNTGDAIAPEDAQFIYDAAAIYLC